MEFEKRKRVSAGEPTDAKRRKSAEDEEVIGAVKTAGLPEDDEVDEFFAILKRIHVALEYFKNRTVGGRDEEMAGVSSSSPLPPWRPLFQPEDFDGGDEKAPEKPDRSGYTGLDLNSAPVADVSDTV